MAEDFDELDTEEFEGSLLDEDEVRTGPGWNWWLVLIPVIAIATFVVVLLYGANTFQPTDLGEDVELFHIVIAGVVILAILLIVEIALLLGRHPDNLEDQAEPAPAPPTPAAREEQAPDLEALETDDEVDGKNVVEVARPPKWAIEGGVYATTYVQVNGATVLRLEEIVALKS